MKSLFCVQKTGRTFGLLDVHHNGRVIGLSCQRMDVVQYSLRLLHLYLDQVSKSLNLSGKNTLKYNFSSSTLSIPQHRFLCCCPQQSVEQI